MESVLGRQSWQMVHFRLLRPYYMRANCVDSSGVVSFFFLSQYLKEMIFPFRSFEKQLCGGQQCLRHRLCKARDGIGPVALSGGEVCGRHWEEAGGVKRLGCAGPGRWLGAPE